MTPMTPMTIAVSVAAEAATEPADQKDDEDDDEGESERHGAVHSGTKRSHDGAVFGYIVQSIQTIFTTPREDGLACARPSPFAAKFLLIADSPRSEHHMAAGRYDTRAD
jgi:hypothetical protein